MNNLCAEIGWKSINHEGEQLCGDHVDIIELDEIAGRARRLGIEYLKVSKSADLDEWIAQAVGRMMRRQEE